MEILEYRGIPKRYKIVKCGNCKSVIKVYRSDVEITSQLGVLHDGIGTYNFNCPVCRYNIDFDHFDGVEVSE